jgi:site-specific recombinase XerD
MWSAALRGLRLGSAWLSNMSTAAEAWLAAKATNTARTYRGGLMALLDSTGQPASQICQADIAAYLTELRAQGLAADTINNARTAIQSFYSYCDRSLEGRNLVWRRCKSVRVDASGPRSVVGSRDG